MTAFALLLAGLPLLMALYAYAVYPALLRLAARRQAAGRPDDAGSLPMVTIVIPAYNEERQIRGAIESILAQDYPAERRQLLVLSDASSDATDQIVGEYASRGVELLRMPVRSGKTAAENASIGRIRGEIVINTDASIRLHPTAVGHLVRAMSDPRVGVASGRDVSIASHGAQANPAEAGYVGYEMRVRALETRAGGIVGASGSGYAIRAELHRVPVRADLSRDFSAALSAERHGYRAVSVDAALCSVPRTASLASEYKRKVRTIARGMETLHANRDLLDPRRHGDFAWKLFSHKVCRWLVPLSCLPAVIGLGLLAPGHPWARWLLAGALLVATLAVMGARWPDSRPVPRWLPTGVLGGLAANLAVVHAAWRFFHGHDDHVWEPTRRHHAA
jgi:cellulose synthase/poly-beta-1,6-N-acetylglucosamine synthase-like glycosyltransferase